MAEILDQFGGVITTIQEDPNDETGVLIRTYQDAQPILEHNKRLQTMNDGYSASRDWKRIASIPTNVAMQWVQEAGIRPSDFFRWPGAAQNEFFRRRYQSSEYAHLRTSPGQSGSRVFTG